MNLEFPKEVRSEAVASIRRYFEENLSEPVSDLAAGLLLNFFVEEIGPVIYNRAIADAQHRMEQRMSDLSGELYMAEFQYWPKLETKRKGRK